MRCPFCSNPDTQVKDSRPTEDGASIRRRRYCPGCSARFTTFERVQLRELTVVKRNNRRAPFDRDKLARSVALACQKRNIDPDRIDQMVSGIVRRLESSGDSDVTSDTIGELVMDALKGLDPVAYVRYASVYKDFREVDDFRDFIKGEKLAPKGAEPPKSKKMTEHENCGVTLKLATSLDGRIALANGASRWITGEASRTRVHQLRAEHDVMLTGIGTVLADDPQMTVRLADHDGRQPGRVVLDTRLRIPETAKLFGEGGPVLVFCGADVPTHARAAIEACGARVESLNRFDGPSISLAAAIERIRALDGDRIMIEAGGRIAASALRSGMVDRIEWFRAPIVLGGDGIPVISALGLERLDEAPIFSRVSVEEVGDDIHEVYVRKAA